MVLLTKLMSYCKAGVSGAGPPLERNEASCRNSLRWPIYV